jgi:hypothetical protein
MAFIPQVDTSIPLSVTDPLTQQARGFELGQAQLAAQRDTQAYEQQQASQKALKQAFQTADTSTPEGQADLIRRVGQIDPKTALGLKAQFQAQQKTGMEIGEIAARTEKEKASTEKSQSDIAAGKREAMASFLGDVNQEMSNIAQIIPDKTLLPGTPTYKERMAKANQMVDQWSSIMKTKYNDPDIQGIIQKIDSHDWQTPDEFRNHLSKFQKLQAQAKQQAPLSNVGRVNADIASGAVTPEQGKALISRETAPTATQINIGDQSQLKSDDLEFMAKQYLAGDTSVMQNLGRGVQGSRNIVALRKEIRKQAEASGESPEQVATRIAEFGGLKAEERATGTRAAQLGIAGNAAFNMAGMVTDASAKVSRTRFMPVNKALLAYEKNTGDPDVVAYGAALTSFIKKEIEAEKKAIGQTKQDIRDRTGSPEGGAAKKLTYDPATGTFK